MTVPSRCCDNEDLSGDHHGPCATASAAASSYVDGRVDLIGTVQELVGRYMELVAALPPKQGVDTMGRSATKVHAPLPVDPATVEERAGLRAAVRQGLRLREEAADLLFRIRAYSAGALSYDERRQAFTIGPCPKEGCDEALQLIQMQYLECGSGDELHTIPRALWPAYERKLFG